MTIPANVRKERPAVAVALFSMVFASVVIGVTAANALSPLLTILSGLLAELDRYTLTFTIGLMVSGLVVVLK